MSKPVEFLKRKLESVKAEVEWIQNQLDEVDARRSELMKQYEENGLTVIDLKAAIKKLEEK